ncbi:MAG TPA: lipoprotein [Burkholderiaceae bacterium]|nr:lipoprotein [Burkholderiaceae bacterium]
MNRLKSVALALIALAGLAGCGNKGDMAPPPASGLAAQPGDGNVVVTWSDDLSVDYWLFVSTDPRLTTDNFTTLTDIRVIRNVRSPYVLCGYADGRTLYLAMNGRTGGGPGGPGTPTINTTLRVAGSVWTLGTAPPVTFSALGYAATTACNGASLPMGTYVAVGPNAAIANSPDGLTFTATFAPPGLETNLNAVVAKVTNPGVVTIQFVAVGDGGATILSSDGATWTEGAPFDAGAPNLNGVALSTATYVAVGDGGFAETSTDGVAWTARATGATEDLHGIGCNGGICVAAGQDGVITRTVDGGASWEVQQTSGLPTLRCVAFGNFNNNLGAAVIAINTWVAVGDGGTVVYSTDGGATWTATTVPGATDFVALAYLTQFMALDSAGNSFTSQDGQTWIGPVPTGLASPGGMVSNGAGFVAVGAGGGTVSSF